MSSVCIPDAYDDCSGVSSEHRKAMFQQGNGGLEDNGTDPNKRKANRLQQVVRLDFGRPV